MFFLCGVIIKNGLQHCLWKLSLLTLHEFFDPEKLIVEKNTKIQVFMTDKLFEMEFEINFIYFS